MPARRSRGRGCVRSPGAFQIRRLAVLATLACSLVLTPAALAQYTPPPSSGDSWYWEIDPPAAGLAGLPAASAPYPAPGSAHIWDTDLFQDSNTSAGARLGIPTGPSPVVAAVHAAGHYSVCYVEAGAYQTGFPDDGDFARADYGYATRRHQMQGYTDAAFGAMWPATPRRSREQLSISPPA
jgi:hypothetical protein